MNRFAPEHTSEWRKPLLVFLASALLGGHVLAQTDKAVPTALPQVPGVLPETRPGQAAIQQPAPDVAAVLTQMFRQYDGYQRSNNAALADLYADNAKIRVVRVYGDGQTRNTDMLGERWKLQVRSYAASGKPAPDAEVSDFSNMRLEALSTDFVMVRAQRFSTRRCFTDRTYYQIWGRTNAGGWLISQEFITTIPLSYCQPKAGKHIKSGG
jgi:hypothetical protein